MIDAMQQLRYDLFVLAEKNPPRECDLLLIRLDFSARNAH
jgi:hypothetical protein